MERRGFNLTKFKNHSDSISKALRDEKFEKAIKGLKTDPERERERELGKPLG